MTNAHIDARRAGRAGQFSPLIEALYSAGQLLGNFLEVQRGRREIARLASFDDTLLADIGIARADVDWALMQPWNADPSLALARRVDRRKAAARWARALRANPGAA